MVARVHWLGEFYAFFLWAVVVACLVLLVGVPADSLNQPSLSSPSVASTDEQPHPASPAVLVALALQVVLLAVMMISYLTIRASTVAKAEGIRHHHRGSHLTFHHRQRFGR
jgi:hypothetical protein